MGWTHSLAKNLKEQLSELFKLIANYASNSNSNSPIPGVMFNCITELRNHLETETGKTMVHAAVHNNSTHRATCHDGHRNGPA